MNGTRKVASREMSNANAKMVKMVTPNGKNLAAGHSMEHHGRHPMSILSNVNQQPFNLQPAGLSDPMI